MTREQAIGKHYDIKCHITESKKILSIINEIYNEHEDAIEMLLKANEEGISRHFNECDKYETQLKAKDEEIERLKAECEYDQRNASMSQRESVILLDKIGAVIKLCEEKITDWRVIESGQEKAYQAILSMLKGTK